MNRSNRTGGRRGRAGKRAAATGPRGFDPAWRRWERPYPPIEQFSADEIEAIHDASLRILRDSGIRVLNADARALYLTAGMCADEGEVIRFDPDALMNLIARAPAEVTLQGRGAGRDVTIGGRHVGVCTTGGTPNFSDLEAVDGPARWPRSTISAVSRRVSTSST